MIPIYEHHIVFKSLTIKKPLSSSNQIYSKSPGGSIVPVSKPDTRMVGSDWQRRGPPNCPQACRKPQWSSRAVPEWAACSHCGAADGIGSGGVEGGRRRKCGECWWRERGEREKRRGSRVRRAALDPSSATSQHSSSSHLFATPAQGRTARRRQCFGRGNRTSLRGEDV